MKKGNALALLPIGIFLILYLGLGILFEYILKIPMGFYNIPIVVVFLIALLVACLQNRSLSFDEKLSLMGKGIGDKNIVTMILIFMEAGIFVGVVGRSSAESVAYFTLSLIPARYAVAVLFVVSCFVSLAMGTSVGTITLITPIAAEIAKASGFPVALCAGSVMGGAMFGDIEKYLDPDYFASHSEGILQTDDSDYSISVIACILTNAYEDLVYNVQDSAEERYPALYDYITKHSVNQSELPEQLDGVQLLGMSTCTDAVTNGRIVLFASVKPWDTTVDGNAAEKITSAERFKQTQNEPFRLTAVGHEQSREKWAALNLLCVCCTVLTLLPVWALKRKFRQFPYAKSKIRELEEADTASKTVVRDLRSFLRRGRIGIILETVLCGIAVCAFCMTEDLHGRMTIEDQWTGGMILLTAAALAVDYLCLRYRGCRLE